MRMRRKKWRRPELDASQVYIKNPSEFYGRWQEAFDKPQPLIIELGCGKGGFISRKAFAHPECNFLAFDIKSDVLGTAKRNIEAVYGSAHCPNVRITAFDIERINLVVSEADRVEEIYINFCNPWPKAKHKKRRLTYTRQLEAYKQFLKPEGKIFFKTDDDELFEESLVYFKQRGFYIPFITFDMTQRPLPENIVTEHEQMFMDRGIKIKGLIALNRGEKQPLEANPRVSRYQGTSRERNREELNRLYQKFGG